MTQIIHTVMANGQTLMPRVMKGILNQSVECCLMVITSRRDWTENYRRNVIANWEEAFKHYEGNIFVGMDSDVVLTNPDAIKTLIEKMEDKEIDMAIVGSKPKSTYNESNPRAFPHQLFAIRGGKLPSFDRIKTIYMCPFCQIIKDMQENGKKIEHIPEIQLEECARKFIRGREP